MVFSPKSFSDIVESIGRCGLESECWRRLLFPALCRAQSVHEASISVGLQCRWLHGQNTGAAVFFVPVNEALDLWHYHLVAVPLSTQHHCLPEGLIIEFKVETPSPWNTATQGSRKRPRDNNVWCVLRPATWAVVKA